MQWNKCCAKDDNATALYIVVPAFTALVPEFLPSELFLSSVAHNNKYVNMPLVGLDPSSVITYNGIHHGLAVSGS